MHLSLSIPRVVFTVFTPCLGILTTQTSASAQQSLAKSSEVHSASPSHSTPHMVISHDGTKIAFEKIGTGPALVIVGGALSHRAGGRPIAAQLADTFSVYIYDRRGRGESTDVKPYAVEREIEDLAALIDHAGGSALVYGASSGAALALQAAAKLGRDRITRLALYEPPYQATNDVGKRDFAEQKQRVLEHLRTGKPGDAVTYFMSVVGAPPAAVEAMKRSPDWAILVKLESTLAYDYAVLGDGAVPVQISKTVRVPVLIMDGEKTLHFMHAATDTLAQHLPHADRKTLPGQTHQADPEVLAPLLIEFFRN